MMSQQMVAYPQQMTWYAEPTAGVGRYDGWMAAFLLWMLVFGPSTAPSPSLPPIRSVDFLILILLISRWLKTSQLHGGFIFSRRMRAFSLPILWIALIGTIATAAQVASGQYIFFLKDYFQPIAMVRMVIIAAIMGSYDFNERHIQQFMKGLLIVSIATAALALVQRFYPHLLAGFIERYYAIDVRRLEIEMTGTQARVLGTLGNPNVFAGFIVILAAGALAIAIYSKRLMRLVALATYFALVVAEVIATASRTGIVALVVVTCFSLLISMQGRARWSALMIMFLMLSAFLTLRKQVADFSFINPRTRELLTGQEGAVSGGIESRYRLWQRSWDEAKTSLVIGTGFKKMAVHITDNGYLFTLMASGILGALAYVGMFVVLFGRGIRAFFREQDRTRRMMLSATVMGLVTMAIFELTGEFFWNIGYGAIASALLGLLCAGTSRERGTGAWQGWESAIAFSRGSAFR